MSTLDDRLAKYSQKTLKFDDQNISYREAGVGVPVVLLHGIGSGSGSWLFQFETLGQEHRLIAWDAPGYGRSSPLEAVKPGVQQYAGALKKFVDSLQLETFHLLGHSLGALIAAAYSYQFSKNILSLILVDPAIGYAKNPPEERDRKNRARIELMEKLGPQGLAKKRAQKLLSNKASEVAVELVQSNMSLLNKDGYIQAANMLANSDLCEFTNGIKLPVLVLCGSADQITPETMAMKVAQSYEHSTYQSLKGLGHASYIEGPELFNQHVRKFAA